MLMFLLSLCILMSSNYTVNAQALQNNASKSLCFLFFMLFLYKAFWCKHYFFFLLFCTEINYLIASNIGSLVAMLPSNYNAF